MEPKKRVSFSHLMQMGKSPAHYASSFVRKPATPLMRHGALIHALVLGGEYVVWPNGDRRGNAWKGFEAEHAGKLIVTAKEYDQAQGAAMAVLASDPAQRVLAGTEKEVPLEWEWLGRGCAGRLDAVGNGKVVELKTSSTSQPWKFTNHVFRMGYHAQLAWYRRAAGEYCRDAYIVAVETHQPYAVTVFQLDDDVLQMGDNVCRVWMEKLLSCERYDEWPAYAQDVVPIHVPDTDDTTLVIDGEDVEL